MKTHLPADLLGAIEHVIGDAEYSLYVLDGQGPDISGEPDDWHDALVLLDQGWNHHFPGGLVKFTRYPSGAIEHYIPGSPRSLTVLDQPGKATA